MRRFLQRYLSKAIIAALFLLLLITIHSVVINNTLENLKPDLQKKIAEFIRGDVFVGNIRYLFPACVELDNVYIRQNQSSLAASAEKIKLTISLTKLLFKQKLLPRSLELKKPYFNYSECLAFIRGNWEKIKEIIRSLPKDQRIKIRLREMSMSLPSLKGPAAQLSADIAIEAKGSVILSAGYLGLKISSAAKNISLNLENLRYNLSLNLTRHGLILDNLEIAGDNLYAKSWGILENNELRLNNMLSLGPGFDLYKSKKPALGRVISLNIFSLLNKPPSQGLLWYPAGPGFIDTRAVLIIADNALKIKNLFFTIKNLPFQLTGDIGWEKSVTLGLRLSSYPNQPPDGRRNNPRALDVDLKGGIYGNKFSGGLGLNLARNASGKNGLIRIDSRIEEALLDFTPKRQLKLTAKRITLNYPLDNGIKELVLENLSGAMGLAGGSIRPIELHSSIAEGALDAYGYIDTGSFPFKEGFNIKLSNVEANKLDAVLEHLSKVHGKADAQINYRSYPQNFFTGSADIYNGSLENFEFLKWLAEFFALPQLTKVGFERLSTNFFVDDKIAKLEDIDIASGELPLKGYFNQSSDDFVASKISLDIPRSLLSASGKFNALLGILGDGFDFLDFDFQLSGSLHRMNFKWLDSEFKTKLKSRIPDFIERGIERKVEGALQGIATPD